MTNAQPRSWRRWLRFSLRSFLIVLTIGGLWLGWFVNRVHQQCRAVEMVNGSVTYAYQLALALFADPPQVLST